MFGETVKGYPTVTYAKTYLAIIEPYEPMFFYYDDMKAWAVENPPVADEEDDEKAFTLWYEKNLRPVYSMIQSAIDEGFVRFDDLWAIFRPKDLVFTVDDFGQPCISVAISSTTENTWNGRSGRSERIFLLEIWWVQWDRTSQTFTRAYREMRIDYYAGSRQITSLPVYPFSYHSGEIVVHGEKKKLMDHLEDRGRKYQGLASVQSVCMHHHGTAYSVELIKRRSFVSHPINSPKATYRDPG